MRGPWHKVLFDDVIIAKVVFVELSTILRKLQLICYTFSM